MAISFLFTLVKFFVIYHLVSLVCNSKLICQRGEVNQDKVDSYKDPYYSPCIEEIDAIVQTQACFTIDLIELIEMGKKEAGLKDGKSAAMAVRAVQETLLVHHFGEDIVDRLFQVYADVLEQEVTQNEAKVVCLLIVLTRNY